MNIIYLKKFMKTLGLCIGLFLVITLLATALNFFNVITTNTMGIFKMIIPVIALLISGIYLGSKAKNKGWKEGLKLSVFIILLLLFFHLVWMNETFGMKINVFDTFIPASVRVTEANMEGKSIFCFCPLDCIISRGRQGCQRQRSRSLYR